MLKKASPALKLLISWVSFSLVLALIDQVTKKLALKNLYYLTPVNVISGFDLTLVFNKGAAFSFLSNAGGWQRWFFTIFAIIAIIGLIVYLYINLKSNAKERLKPLGVSLIIGGAIGNLIDRVYYGYVIDFISLYYENWYWPAFNFADVFISVGVLLLFLEIIFFENKV